MFNCSEPASDASTSSALGSLASTVPGSAPMVCTGVESVVAQSLSVADVERQNDVVVSAPLDWTEPFSVAPTALIDEAAKV